MAVKLWHQAMTVVGSGMRKEDREEARKARALELMAEYSPSSLGGQADSSTFIREKMLKAAAESQRMKEKYDRMYGSVWTSTGAAVLTSSPLSTYYIADEEAPKPDKTKEGPQYDWSKHSGE